mgnify:FL=1
MKLHKNGELFLFDDFSKMEGGRDQHLVIIQSLDNTSYDSEDNMVAGVYVMGLLQNDFDYRITAEYDQMFDSIIENAPGTGLVRKGFQLAGRPLGASGIFKRKFYKGGSHISFTVDFRIMSDAPYHIDDTNNSNALQNPKACADWLANLCLPVKNITVKTIIDNSKKVYNQAEAKKNQHYSKEKAMKAGGAFMKEMVDQVGDSPFTRTVRVKIGNMFESFDMIVESVNVKYSKQNIYSNDSEGLSKYNQNDAKMGGDSAYDEGKSNLQAYQPLYVDISMQVSTATVPNQGNTGLLTPQPQVSVRSSVKDVAGNFEFLGGKANG